MTPLDLYLTGAAVYAIAGWAVGARWASHRYRQQIANGWRTIAKGELVESVVVVVVGAVFLAAVWPFALLGLAMFYLIARRPA